MSRASLLAQPVASVQSPSCPLPRSGNLVSHAFQHQPHLPEQRNRSINCRIEKLGLASSACSLSSSSSHVFGLPCVALRDPMSARPLNPGIPLLVHERDCTHDALDEGEVSLNSLGLVAEANALNPIGQQIQLSRMHPARLRSGKLGRVPWLDCSWKPAGARVSHKAIAPCPAWS